MKHGYGRMQWPDGQMYSGGWKNNKRSGQGIQTDSDGTLIHCGQWVDDEPVAISEDVPKDVHVDRKKRDEIEENKSSPDAENHLGHSSQRLESTGCPSPDQKANGEGEDLSSTLDQSSSQNESEAASLDCRAQLKYEENLMAQRIAPSRLVL